MKESIRLFTFAFAIAPLVATAQEQRDLPPAREVVAKFVEVTGGKEKYEAVKTMTAKGKFTIREFGTGGSIEIQFAAPDKAKLTVDVQGFGKFEKGNLGKVAWEVSPATGARLLEGEEASRFLDGLNMKTIYAPESVYESIENAGIEEVEDEPCYKLAMKRKDSEEVDYTFYSVKTGLAVKAITQEPTQSGKITANTTLSEYKEIDGIKSAMKIVQELVGVGMTQEIELESIKYNEPIEDAVFELPAAVNELAKQAEENNKAE